MSKFREAIKSTIKARMDLVQELRSRRKSSFASSKDLLALSPSSQDNKLDVGRVIDDMADLDDDSHIGKSVVESPMTKVRSEEKKKPEKAPLSERSLESKESPMSDNPKPLNGIPTSPPRSKIVPIAEPTKVVPSITEVPATVPPPAKPIIIAPVRLGQQGASSKSKSGKTPAPTTTTAPTDTEPVVEGEETSTTSEPEKKPGTRKTKASPAPSKRTSKKRKAAIEAAEKIAEPLTKKPRKEKKKAEQSPEVWFFLVD
jgi:hypothetical protein